ncbi:MAG: DUF4295 family protein [Bacteroidales bacterium]
MAKKSVATFTAEKSSKRNVVKCIRMDKSPRTGAYIFKDEIIPVSETKEFFKK